MPLRKDIRLQDHQRQALGRTSGGGQILNWGLGSGKTLGAIAMAERRGGNVLVVTPASLRPNFIEQLARFVPKGRRRAYTIMSYDKFRRDPRGTVARLRPNTLIADEVHRIRNPRPREPFEAVRQNVPFMIGLTGSLINNRPEEVVPLVNLIAGKKVFDSVEQFKADYIRKERVSPGIVGILKGVGWGTRESMRDPEDFRAHTSPYVHRFTGSPEYKKHVPKVVEENVQVTMTPRQEKLYKALSSENPILAYKMRHNLPPSKKDLKSMNAFMTAARQIMNNPLEYIDDDKLDVIEESPKFQRMIKDVQRRAKKDPNYRGVIYSNFLSSGVEPVVTELNRRGVKSEAFTGGLNDKQRQKLVDDLNRGRTKILGLSPAGGEGLDLKGVRTVQLTEEHWNPERGQQAVGRSARFKSHSHLPASQREVEVRRYIATHRPTLFNKWLGTKKDMSPDEWINARRREKLELNQEFLRALEKSAMNTTFEIGLAEAMDKVAKGLLHPRAIAAGLAEGHITPTTIARFKLTPGEMKKARGIAEKNRRKAMRPTIASRLTPSQQIGRQRLQYMSGVGAEGPRTQIIKNPLVPKLASTSKEAGIRDALYTAATGRVPLLHGTSKTVAKKVMGEGLKPQASKGISNLFGLEKAEKGLSFLTRNKAQAKHYARQQAGVERWERVKGPLSRFYEKHKGKLPQGARDVADVVKDTPEMQVPAARALSKIPGNKRVLRANVPRHVLRKAEGNVPELSGEKMEAARKFMREAHPQAEKLPALLFSDMATMKGGTPSKYIKGSKDYQRPTMGEIASHLKDAVKNPREYAKDVGRSLTGMSHRPSTLLKQNPLAGEGPAKRVAKKRVAKKKVDTGVKPEDLIPNERGRVKAVRVARRKSDLSPAELAEVRKARAKRAIKKGPAGAGGPRKRVARRREN